MLRSTVITGLLSSRLRSIGEDAAVDIVGTPDHANLPDRAVLIALSPGAGLMLSGTFEQPGLQVRVRGRQNVFSDAEDLMIKVDNILMNSQYPFMYQGVYFLPPDYTGGGPSALPIDDGGRTVFVGNYTLQVEVRSADG